MSTKYNVLFTHRMRQLTKEAVKVIHYGYERCGYYEEGEYKTALRAMMDAADQEMTFQARATAEVAQKRAGDKVVYEAVFDTALALCLREVITTEQYSLLTYPVRQAIGPVHPLDEDPRSLKTKEVINARQSPEKRYVIVEISDYNPRDLLSDMDLVQSALRLSVLQHGLTLRMIPVARSPYKWPTTKENFKAVTALTKTLLAALKVTK